MEVSLEGCLVRAAQTVRPLSAKPASAEPDAAASVQVDQLTLTRQVIEKMEEQSRSLQNLLQPKKQEEMFPLLQGLEGEKSELDALSKGLKVIERCHKIAARIMRGDKVPPKDAQYLMENDPEGYKLAMAMRRPKKKPKEWESVLKDEEKAEQTSGGEIPAPAAPCGASEDMSVDMPEDGTPDGSAE